MLITRTKAFPLLQSNAYSQCTCYCPCPSPPPPPYYPPSPPPPVYTPPGERLPCVLRHRCLASELAVPHKACETCTFIPSCKRCQGIAMAASQLSYALRCKALHII